MKTFARFGLNLAGPPDQTSGETPKEGKDEALEALLAKIPDYSFLVEKRVHFPNDMFMEA